MIAEVVAPTPVNVLEEQEEDEFIFNEITSSLEYLLIDHEVVGKEKQQNSIWLPLTTLQLRHPMLMLPLKFH